MKKAKLLLFLVMILVVASMVLFACGDEDAHDCKDENFDHKCDVCETSISCFDNDNNHNCDICGKELSHCFDNTNNHKCELCGETITSCKDENRDHSCDICGKISSCEDKTNDHKCDVCEKELSACADENSDHKCDVCNDELTLCKDEDDDEFCDICNEYVGRSLSFIKNQDNTYSVSGFSGSPTDVIIPSTYNGLPVTSIGDAAFRNCTSLTSVVIGDGVTSIGDGAFGNCTSLTSVVIPSSVTSIGGWAFDSLSLTIYCEAESQPSGWDSYWNYSGRPVVWGYDASNLKIIDGVHYYIKDSSAMVTGRNANVTNVTILSTIENNGDTYSVTSIGDRAFYRCRSLTSVVIPSSVTSIGEYAFYECWSLTSIEIPSNVTSIGSSAFSYCRSLTSIEIPSSVTSIGVMTFYECRLLTSIEIPSSVTSIGSSAFEGCASLTSVVIHGSVTSIGVSAFESCASLTSIEIPSSVTSIGSEAFSHCRSLTSIEIPSSVTSIGEYAFMWCASLTSIEIPSSVTSIGGFAFGYCTSLTIYCEAESEPSGWGTNWNSSYRPVVWGYDASNLKIIDGVQYYIKDGSAVVTGHNANVTNVTILSTIENNGVTYSVTSIGDGAFRNCTSLTSIEIPSSVTSIGSEAFSYCSSLTSIEIPSSVTSIGEYAFEGCKLLTIYCEAESQPSGWDSSWNIDSPIANYRNRPVVWGYDASNLKIIDGVHYYIKDGSAMVTGRNANITNVTILSTIENKGVTYSVTSIGDQAFYECRSLTSIEIPNSVTSIGSSAFYYCDSLTSIVIPSSVTSIGSEAFCYCDSLMIYCEAESEPSGWHSYWKFSDRPVVWGCDTSNLKIIDGVHYYIIYGIAMVTGHNANVTNVTILSTIENNGVTYRVTSIGEWAFAGCTSLRSIEIPSSVTSIGECAFRYCSSLTSIVIPSSVTSIDTYAFYECSSLTIYCEAESKPSGWYSFWNYDNRPVEWGYSENA